MFQSISLKLKVFFLLLVGAGLVFLFLPRERSVTNYPSSGRDIVAIGDSLVYGVGSQSGGFVSLLGAPVINLGISGDTSKDVLERIDVLDQYKPKVVILLVGGNDFLRRVPQGETFSNIGRTIEEIHKRDASVLLLGVRSGVLSNRYDKEYEALADKYGTGYVEDVLDGIFGHEDLMSDTIHPNDKGYALIAERVRPELEKIIR